MKPFIAALALLLVCATAHAQNSSHEQALSAKLLSEINAGLQCGSALIDVQRELGAAQAHIKELEAQTGAQKDDNK